MYHPICNKLSVEILDDKKQYEQLQNYVLIHFNWGLEHFYYKI